ncbi:hypothetical protein TcCL_NonESM04687 [Trypanosoma cruzi]|nr:hypothetical protein TcCL_NonESM04687 [Trypanosoma cruzi]
MDMDLYWCWWVARALELLGIALYFVLRRHTCVFVRLLVCFCIYLFFCIFDCYLSLDSARWVSDGACAAGNCGQLRQNSLGAQCICVPMSFVRDVDFSLSFTFAYFSQQVCVPRASWRQSWPTL